MTTSPLLQVDSLGAAYDDNLALSNVNLCLDVGQWASVIGPNGSGKSTLLACIVGNLAPSAGTVLINGKDVNVDPSAAKQCLGFAMPPELIPGELSGTQCLDIFAMARGLSTVDSATLTVAKQLGMTDHLSKLVARYSMGMRQKLAVLLALVGEPTLLVLDETFNGLDAASSLFLKSHLSKSVSAGRFGVILATHSLDVVRNYCDQAHLLVEGQLTKSWGQAELRHFRENPQATFESSIAEAAENPAAVPTAGYTNE